MFPLEGEAAQEPGTIQAAPAANTLTNTSWQHLNFSLPMPSLQFLFHLECDLEPPRTVGPGPYGNRMAIMFTGGRFEGPRMRGIVLPGGGDWLTMYNNPPGQQTAHLDTRYNLETHDGAVIYIQTTGTRSGPREVIERIPQGNVGPDEYRMRLTIRMETGDERYSWVNQGVFIASAGKSGNSVVYDAYQVL